MMRLSCLLASTATAIVVRPASRVLITRMASTLPSVEQLQADSFLKQVSYAQTLIQQLADEDPLSVQDSLTAQLSHSDGIRGFFVAFLTAEPPSLADEDPLPAVLLSALQHTYSEDLLSLACMNVIMPTGMVTMHTDEKLSQQSAWTAERGCRVLHALREMHPTEVEAQCRAILAVAEGRETGNDQLVCYWADFFEKWGYGEAERVTIAAAMQNILST